MADHWQVEFLKRAAEQSGMSLTAIAKGIGVSSTTLTRPVNDPDHNFLIKQSTIDAVAALTGVPIDAGSAPVHVEPGEAGPDGSKLIPVYDVAASAGFGSLVDYEAQTHSLAFPPDYLRTLTSSSPQNLAIIAVKGESMEPTLLDNDIVLVDMSKRHMGFEGMFVIRQNETLLVKRASMAAKKGFVKLLSDNQMYPPIDAELAEIEVIGKVLWYGRKV